jgi:exopolyphosphatase/guanosine-5'-triphosphate,3'-diphosphate pyrophosphatase
MMMDLGGGSCELTISAENHIRYTASLPLGAVRLTEEFLRHDPPRGKELERLHGFVLRELTRAARRVQSFRPQVVIATSGTAAALAALCSGSKQTRQRPSQPVARARVKKISAKLQKMPIAERRSLPGVGPRRAEIIVAGAVVFSHILEQCRLRRFRYSPLGLRDGLLAQMAADYDRHTRQRRQIESERLDAILAMGKNYKSDLKYALRVRAAANQLFSALRQIHGLPPEYEEWISAAAMLHEIGIYVNRYGWHRHTHYVIANSEIFGYTAYERQLIAAIARYLGNSVPAAGDRIVRGLRQADRVCLPKAVLLLRLARAVNQSRTRPAAKITVRQKKNTIGIVLHSRARAHSELELWALAKERAYFREVFGRELEGIAS